MWASVVVHDLRAVPRFLEHRLNSRGVTCGMLKAQKSNPCLLHWQANSLPLSHQGSPSLSLLKFHFSCFHPTKKKSELSEYTAVETAQSSLPSVIT